MKTRFAHQSLDFDRGANDGASLSGPSRLILDRATRDEDRVGELRNDHRPARYLDDPSNFGTEFRDCGLLRPPVLKLAGDLAHACSRDLGDLRDIGLARPGLLQFFAQPQEHADHRQRLVGGVRFRSWEHPLNDHVDAERSRIELLPLPGFLVACRCPAGRSLRTQTLTENLDCGHDLTPRLVSDSAKAGEPSHRDR